MINKNDIHCYRTNYSKDWLKKSPDGYDIPYFPCVGAVIVIHILCDEYERLEAENERLRDAARKLVDVSNSGWPIYHGDYLVKDIEQAMKDTESV